MTRPRALALARTASMDMDPIPMDWTDARTRGDDARAAVGFCLEAVVDCLKILSFFIFSVTSIFDICMEH